MVDSPPTFYDFIEDLEQELQDRPAGAALRRVVRKYRRKIKEHQDRDTYWKKKAHAASRHRDMFGTVEDDDEIPF